MKRFANGWLAERDIRAGARMRLFCLPHAGSGAAAFYRWKRELAATIDVCPVLLPGREMRIREASVEDAVVLADDLAESTRAYLDVPFAIFGHSMGSLLAYVWAVRLAEAKGPQPQPEPRCLFVSGREAATLPLAFDDIHHLSDEAFVTELGRRYGGVPDGMLEDAELREVFLPILRADLKLVETYRHGPEALLRCPMVACAGIGDPGVTDAGLNAWGELTTGKFEARRSPGDHFYSVGVGQRELLDLIVRKLG
jgi:medium-chain acyl-[acyl-carrier-protein] hydrolase